MTGQEAIDALDAAFAAKALLIDDRPVIGIFGNGLPFGLIRAFGCVPVDVKSASDARLDAAAAAIVGYLEPFLDDFARHFLHRLAEGDFDSVAAIVFPRDDAAALTAYQYALELRRQGVIARGPRLLLWTLVHGRSDAIAAFNAAEVESLAAGLAAANAGTMTPETFARAQAAERTRAAALWRLEALAAAERPVVCGAEAFRWRNAGRWLEAEHHAALLDAACAHASLRPGRTGLRIGLVGTALDDPRVYDAIETAGTIVCDLQPFGAIWPGPGGRGDAATPQDLARVEAGDPLAARARPELGQIDALIARLVETRCDLVVAQYDQHDDTFGWDLPGLKSRLRAHGVPLVDLGFRAHRPDEGWLAAIRVRLATVEAPAHV